MIQLRHLKIRKIWSNTCSQPEVQLFKNDVACIPFLEYLKQNFTMPLGDYLTGSSWDQRVRGMIVDIGTCPRRNRPNSRYHCRTYVGPNVAKKEPIGGPGIYHTTAQALEERKNHRILLFMVTPKPCAVPVSLFT